VLHTHSSKTHAVESHQMTALSNKILLCISVTRCYVMPSLASYSIASGFKRSSLTQLLKLTFLVIFLGVTSNISEQYHEVRSDRFVYSPFQFIIQ
jgi:hypothetical protein